MTSFPHLISALCRQVWALEESRVHDLFAVVERRVFVGKLTPEQIEAIRGERDASFPNGAACYFGASAAGAIEARGNSRTVAAGGDPAAGSLIAVINVFGIIAQHAAQVDDISGPGGTSTERVAASFRQALADPAVKAIVLNVNSPGGSVSGVEALAEEIFKARGKKPVIAQCNSLMASAAYWIGAAADEIVMTPGSQAGSIGVYGMHEDVSGALEKAGVKITFISAGKFKVEGNPYEPLDEEAASAQQRVVNAYYSDFTKFVAKARGVKVDAVRNGFGQGRIEKDSEAVKAGMADRVATLDETLRRVATAPSGKQAQRAEGFPLMSLADHEAAKSSITLRTEESGKVYVEAAWPEETVAAEGTVSIDNDGFVSMPFENGVACYEVTGHDEERGLYLLSLQEGSTFSPPPAAANPAPEPDNSAADRDAFRRRRHAHRMRSQ